MATTVQGFVVRVFAGRAGLFTATIVPPAGGPPVEVQVSDLDGEPERFNERLTKVRLFREALSNAEPVVVIYNSIKSGGNEVESIRRITRNHVAFGTATEELTCIIVGVSVEEVHQINGLSEASDVARVRVLDPITFHFEQCTLAMQRAERGVAEAMFDLLRHAESTGEPLHLRIVRSEGGAGFDPAAWIVHVGHTLLNTAELVFDGFVESICARPVMARPFAEVLITTSPKLIGVGRVADPSFFEPEPVRCLVSYQSVMLRLLERALTAGERVRVGLAKPRSGKRDDHTNDATTGKNIGATGLEATAEVESKSGQQDTSRDPSAVESTTSGLLLGVAVLAPLASAARPVWIRVRRESLESPPVNECVGPMPSSDLSPADIASLQLPHRAAWEGEGCFNHGVYRIQVLSPVPVKVFIDGKPLACMAAPFAAPPPPAKDPAAENVDGLKYAIVETLSGRAMSAMGNIDITGKNRVYLGHACLADLHTLRIEVEEWRCGYKLQLDVFKLR